MKVSLFNKTPPHKSLLFKENKYNTNHKNLKNDTKQKNINVREIESLFLDLSLFYGFYALMSNREKDKIAKSKVLIFGILSAITIACQIYNFVKECKKFRQSQT